jgi:hypothetical protein
MERPVTPRTTRLVRVGDLHGFRDAAAALACAGNPHDALDRLVVVPTRAAASHFVRSIENRLPAGDAAVILADFVTRDELHARLAERLPCHVPLLTPAEREVLLGEACRAASAEDVEAPFRLRPGLIAEILRFYDALRRNRRDVGAFERLALAALEAGAVEDRGAERLQRQTRFLVCAFRRFEQRCRESGAVDEHALPALLLATPVERPWRHVLVTIGDHAVDPHGLFPVDWDLLARLPGLEHLDVLATDSMVAGAFHELIHQLLPGIEEIRFEACVDRPAPVLLIPATGTLMQTARDREEEVAGFARLVRQAARERSIPALDRAALVVRRPLPYVYLAREVLRSAGIPCQMFDALPLASEPCAAALDLVFSFVSSDFAAAPGAALLRSPHFCFADGSRAEPEVGAEIARELLPLHSPAPGAEHLSLLISFLTRHESSPGPEDPLRERHLRGRSAVLGILVALRDAYHRFDSVPLDFDAVAAVVRRWIEGQTFAPRTGESGVHVIDAASAPFGDFDLVQLAGLVDGEWPDLPRRNVFYSPALLRALDWPPESSRREGARAAFRDLLRLPRARLVVSTFTLEEDAVVPASGFVDEIEAAGLDAAEYVPSPLRVFQDEALAFDPVDLRPIDGVARPWTALRVEPVRRDPLRFGGTTRGHAPDAFSLSALERYQDCPFKFFAADVLRLEEPADDDVLSPRARGRFLHEVFQRFFEEWAARGNRGITPVLMDDARAAFEHVASEMLARLPDAEASLERLRLFGSAVSPGVVDIVLGLEASRPAQVRERRLEYRLEGAFSLGAADGRRVRLKGVADRVDLLEGNRLRVIDYKSGSAPNPKRALQAPIYALCAQERLAGEDGSPWIVDEAAYVAFSGKRALVPVVHSGADGSNGVLAAARDRVYAAVDSIGRGEFPPRPEDPMMCTYCAYASVCRKDYVGDE